MSKSSRVYSLVVESGDLERFPNSWSHVLIIRDQYGNDHGWAQFGVARLDNTDIIRPESDARERLAGRLAQLEWEDSLPLGVRSSTITTEARTVLSRAETAIRTLSSYLYDPEYAEAIYDLELAVFALEKYRRTGKTPRYSG